MRPEARRQIFLDAAAIIALFRAIMAAGLIGEVDLLQIFDLIADGVREELDFRNEARNAAAFEASLAFLGYATVPKVVPELSTGPRVLVTEWVRGRHLAALDDEAERLRFARLAVEATTCGLVCTGLVHADPHEV